MGNSLDELASYFLPLAQALLTDCEGFGIPCRVIDTGRTFQQQEQKLAEGVSWTQNSKHLPQPPEEKSEAIDIAPEAILDEHKADWDPPNPLWEKIGKIGEALGLEWGGSWVHNPDPSHFQYIHKAVVTDPEIGM